MFRTVIASRDRLRAAAIPMTLRLITALCGAVALVALGTAAMAFWTTGGGGSGSGSSGTMNAPTNVFASSPGGANVDVSWGAATLGTGQAADGYYVVRIRNSDSSTAPACGTSPSASTAALSCNDTGVPDGAYHYIVTALYGSWTAQSADSPTVNVASDTTPPPAPSAPALTAASDSGASSSDAITNNTTPTFAGTAEAGSTVTLYDGVTSVGSTVATGGNYTITASTRPAGTRSFTAKATDAALNTSVASAATSVVLDTSAPATPAAPVLDAASDSGLSSSDRVTNDTTPTFTGSAEVSSTVSLYDGVALVGTATATGGTYNATSSVRTDGTKTVTIRATDVAGNASTSSPAVMVTIDTVGPTGTLNQASGQTDPSSALSINFTATFNETVYGFIGTDITYSGTAGATTAAVTGAGPYNVAVSGMTQSGTVISALTASKVTDAAGNANSAATSTDATVTYVDATAPAAPSTPVLTTATDTGSSSSDAITNNTAPTYTGTAEIGSIVRIYRAGSTLVATSGVVPGTGIYTATTSPALAQGTYSITARATDAASNQGVPSAARSMTIDTAAPSVTVARAASQGATTTTSPINFTVTFSEAIYGFVGSDVVITGTASAGTTSTITGTGPYNVAVSGMRSDGTVIAALPANAVQDVAGNNSAAVTGAAAGRTVTYDDNTAPAIVITSMIDSGAGVATISGTAGILPGDSPTITVVVCKNSNASCPASQQAATLTGVPVDPVTGAWSITTGFIGNLPTAYAKATQTDGGGNTGTSNNFGPVPIT